MTWLSPSQINSFDYCEVQFFLQNKLGYDPKKTRAINIGKQAHKEKLEEIPPEMPSLKEGLVQSFSGKIGPIYQREVKVKSYSLFVFGKIDEVKVEKSLVRVIEDKSGKLRESHKMQALAYAVLFKHTFGDYPILVGVRNIRTGEIVWEKKLEESDEERVAKLFTRMRAILDGRTKPQPTKNINKCIHCGVNYVCEIYKKRKEMGLVP